MRLKVYLHRFLRFFSVPFGSTLGGFWGVFLHGCGFSLCLAVVRWAVDRRTAARATPLALPVGVIFGLLPGAFGCFRVCDCMRWRMRLHVLAGGDVVPRCSTHGAPAPLAEGRGRLSGIALRSAGRARHAGPHRPRAKRGGHDKPTCSPWCPNCPSPGGAGGGNEPPAMGKGGKRGKGAAEPAESGSPQGWSPLAGSAARPAGPRPGGRGAYYAAPFGAGR